MKKQEEFEFELLLTEKIIKSIENEPEQWSKSIIGLKRNTDGLELYVNVYAGTEIHRPYKYTLKNKKLIKQLNKVSINLFKIKREEEQVLLNSLEKENKSKLAEFLNIDSRSNKLKKLKKIDQNNQSLFKRFFNLKLKK